MPQRGREEIHADFYCPHCLKPNDGKKITKGNPESPPKHKGKASCWKRKACGFRSQTQNRSISPQLCSIDTESTLSKQSLFTTVSGYNKKKCRSPDITGNCFNPNRCCSLNEIILHLALM